MPTEPSEASLKRDVRMLAEDAEVRAVLEELCALTGMGFAAVARVTEKRWIACQVLDRIAFGMEPGSELTIQTTICEEIRHSGEAVIIDWVKQAPLWAVHPVPALYGFQSYASLPLYRNGDFFGTLCAIDPEPHQLSTPEMRATFDLLAERVVERLTQIA